MKTTRHKTPTKGKEVKASSTWWCETCQTAEMEYPAMKEHLQSAHKLKVEKLLCTKTMRMHMDGATWFSYVWDIVITSGKKKIALTNSTMNPRSMDDPMRDVGE